MTVINMISCGEEGIAVADEQSTTRIRKYNIAPKLHLLNDQFVYGGSGRIDFIIDIYHIMQDNVKRAKQDKRDLKLEDVYRLAQETLIHYKNQHKNQVLSINLGISIDDMLTGTLGRVGKKLDESAINAGKLLLQNVDEHTGMELLLGGLEDDKFKIYALSTSFGGVPISRPYCSIGSGSDESEKVLSRYVANLPRDKRECIDLKEGLVKILEATNASSNLNVGVGGTPSIVYVSKDQIIRPNEQQCILASELVEGLTSGLLDKEFTYDALSRLVFKDEDFQTVEEEMKEKSSDWRKLDRILRGYKENN